MPPTQTTNGDGRMALCPLICRFSSTPALVISSFCASSVRRIITMRLRSSVVPRRTRDPGIACARSTMYLCAVDMICTDRQYKTVQDRVPFTSSLIVLQLSLFLSALSHTLATHTGEADTGLESTLKRVLPRISIPHRSRPHAAAHLLCHTATALRTYSG
jgi:hypothetical protein